MIFFTYLTGLAHEYLGSSARVANEFYETKIDFSLIQSDFSSFRTTLKNKRGKSKHPKHPIILLKGVDLPWMKFLDEDQRRAFLRGEIVDVLADPDKDYLQLEYVNDWAWRFKTSRVGVILPERANDFFGPQNPEVGALFALAQHLASERKLDSDLYDAFVTSVNKKRVIVVLDIGIFNLLPPLMRIVRINATQMIYYV